MCHLNHRFLLRSVFTNSVKSVLPSTKISKLVKCSRLAEKLSIKVDEKEYLGINPDGGVFVVGFGKAIADMALSLQSVLPSNAIHSGVISVPVGTKVSPLLGQAFRVYHGAEGNIPNDASAMAAIEIKKLVEKAASCKGVQESILFVLVSGGGSALLPMPVDGVSLSEKTVLIKDLSLGGANIQDLNKVRTFLSKIKGGKLAQMAYPIRTITLIVSDIVGDPLDLIASGPTVSPSCSPKAKRLEVMEILEHYQITAGIEVPSSITGFLENATNLRSATPEPFHHVSNFVLACNQDALEFASDFIIENYPEVFPFVLQKPVVGDANEVGRAFAGLARYLVKRDILDDHVEALLHWNKECESAFKRFQGDIRKHHFCLISGGETTVIVKGSGLGGRNQQMALVVAEGIKEIDGVSFLSAGTDGVDGPTDACGAVIDKSTMLMARSKGLNPNKYLMNNDSYTFFKELADELIIMGHSGTNVMDMQFLMICK